MESFINAFSIIDYIIGYNRRCLSMSIVVRGRVRIYNLKQKKNNNVYLVREAKIIIPKEYHEKIEPFDGKVVYIAISESPNMATSTDNVFKEAFKEFLKIFLSLPESIRKKVKVGNMAVLQKAIEELKRRGEL